MHRAQTVLAPLVMASFVLGNVAPAFAQDAPPPGLPAPGYTPPPPPAGYDSPPGGGAPPPGSRPAAPPPLRARPSAQVRFEPDEPDVQLLSMSGAVPVEHLHAYRVWWGWHTHYSYGWAPTYAPVCDGACATTFEPGAYQLALSKDGGPPIPVYGTTVINGPARLRGTYTDKSGVRAGGWIIGVGGLVGGIVMLAASGHERTECDPDGYCHDHETADAGLAFGGLGVIIATGIVGAIMISQRDRAHITLEPLRLSSYGRLREMDAALGAYSNPEGASLALHF